MLHFFNTQVPESYAKPKTGLSDFCTTLVEQHDDELVETLAKATKPYKKKRRACMRAGMICKCPSA